MKPNEKWHDSHRMQADPTREERVKWHAEHSTECGCRPVPRSLVAEVEALNKKKSGRTD